MSAHVPAVTVIMPVRDAGAYLAPAVESILTQTFGDLELVAIDDGSTDGSGEVLERFALRDARIRVVRQAGRGLVATLNGGLELARGRFVARMDADDVSAPERLAHQVACLEARPEVGAVGCFMRILRTDGPTAHPWTAPVEPSEIRAQLAHRTCLSHATMVARRDVLIAIGGYRAQFVHAEDADLEARLSERVDLSNVPLPLYDYRMHGVQVGVRCVQQQTASYLAARACARARATSGRDPADGRALPFARDDVLALGVSVSEHDDAVVRRYVDVVRELLHNGLVADAERAQDELAAFTASYPSAWAAAELCLLRAHVLRAKGRLPAAAGQVVRACLARPSTAGRLALRALSRAQARLRRG